MHRRVRGEAAQASPDAGGVRTLSHLCGDVRVFKPGASACGPVLGLARRRRVCPQSSRHAHASRLRVSETPLTSTPLAPALPFVGASRRRRSALSVRYRL